MQETINKNNQRIVIEIKGETSLIFKGLKFLCDLGLKIRRIE